MCHSLHLQLRHSPRSRQEQNTEPSGERIGAFGAEPAARVQGDRRSLARKSVAYISSLRSVTLRGVSVMDRTIFDGLRLAVPCIMGEGY